MSGKKKLIDIIPNEIQKFLQKSVFFTSKLQKAPPPKRKKMQNYHGRLTFFLS